VYVIASYAGADTNPPWYHNLVANPQVEVEVGTERYPASAAVLEEPQRSDVYAALAAVMPAFGEYQTKTSRTIPVVELIR
jgi:deazaflavin-dependent oxidoreductase (nitroreductase family)